MLQSSQSISVCNTFWALWALCVSYKQGTIGYPNRLIVSLITQAYSMCMCIDKYSNTTCIRHNFAFALLCHNKHKGSGFPGQTFSSSSNNNSSYSWWKLWKTWIVRQHTVVVYWHTPWMISLHTNWVRNLTLCQRTLFRYLNKHQTLLIRRCQLTTPRTGNETLLMDVVRFSVTFVCKNELEIITFVFLGRPGGFAFIICIFCSKYLGIRPILPFFLRPILHIENNLCQKLMANSTV